MAKIQLLYNGEWIEKVYMSHIFGFWTPQLTSDYLFYDIIHGICLAVINFYYLFFHDSAPASTYTGRPTYPVR